MQAAAQKRFVQRMIGAAGLDRATYEEVEHDRDALMQAALVVVLGSLAAGIGAIAEGGIGGLILLTIAGLLGWAVYAGLAFLIGSRLLAEPQTRADWGELARALGFANSPRLLLVLGIVPVVGVIVGIGVFVWMILTTVVAIQAALDFDDMWRAIVTAVLALLAQAVIFGVLFAIVAG